jgi:hypothetical protein
MLHRFGANRDNAAKRVLRLGNAADAARGCYGYRDTKPGFWIRGETAA